MGNSVGLSQQQPLWRWLAGQRQLATTLHSPLPDAPPEAILMFPPSSSALGVYKGRLSRVQA